MGIQLLKQPTLCMMANSGYKASTALRLFLTGASLQYLSWRIPTSSWMHLSAINTSDFGVGGGTSDSDVRGDPFKMTEV